MDFIDQNKQFAKRVESLQDSLATEEATKTSIIMPFFALLGYDVFNPSEFTPEFTSDYGVKKGEKKEQPAIDVGQVGIFIIEGEGYIKKYGGDRLVSLNAEYDDIIFSEHDEESIRCVGKVIGRV